MKEWSPVLQWRVSSLAFALLLPVATRSSTSQSPIPQSEPGSANEPKLTAAKEKDSYELYSILLRTEMPPQWNITAWAIRQETQKFPAFGSSNEGHLRQCLSVSQDQKFLYQPLIQDYIAKNKRTQLLERKFDIAVIFEVSAVGFSGDRTRALVYVGHHCGSLCGGGGYHLLVKRDGKWQIDREYRGPLL